jgi:AP-2 complex subunit alpha
VPPRERRTSGEARQGAQNQCELISPRHALRVWKGRHPCTPDCPDSSANAIFEVAVAMAMRGLVVFISDIRNCTSKEQEQKRIDKEMANIRQKFSKPQDLNGYQRKKYVWKILYMFMLGYEVDFGHMESVGLISSPRYSEKMVGYMACSLLLREGDELLRLIINSIKNDLVSNQDNFMCLAMGSICTVGGREFAETLSGDVQKILLNPMTKVYVRKKAALTLLRLYRKNQEATNPAEIADRVLALLDDSNLGALTCIVGLILGLLVYSTEGWSACPQRAIGLLTRIVMNKEYSNDYLYYGIPSPWLQIRLLRMITFFPPLSPQRDRMLVDRLVHVLQRIIATTEVTKNVNKNNATHAVLFEAIHVIIHQGRATELLGQAVALLGRFISIREANIRYLGLETMARLAQHPECAGDVKRHQSTILFSLKDADVSIRRRALDLVYSMCDYSNCRETIAELLTYLANADFNLREELVLKIAILAERFADDYACALPRRVVGWLACCLGGWLRGLVG